MTALMFPPTSEMGFKAATSWPGESFISSFMETCKKPPYWMLHGRSDKSFILVGGGIMRRDQGFYPARQGRYLNELKLRGLPASGPLRGTAGQGGFPETAGTAFSLCTVMDPPRGRPAG